MSTYTLTAEEYDTAREKLVRAQTLLNAQAVAVLEGKRLPSTEDQLAFAEEAEDLIHDVVDLLYGLTETEHA